MVMTIEAGAVDAVVSPKDIEKAPPASWGLLTAPVISAFARALGCQIVLWEGRGDSAASQQRRLIHPAA